MDPNILIFGIIAMVVLILLTIAYLLIYSGFFHRVDVGAGKPPVQDLYVAYKFSRGPYKNAGEMFTEIVSLAPNQRSIGVYYDDPEQVPEERLRFIVGCVMAEGSQRPDRDLAEQLQKRKYKFTYFPAVTNVVKTTFPCTTTLSIYIAISRVYPILGKYIREHKLCAHPIMELYDGSLINFIAPLARQDEFYVPETDDGYVDEEDDNKLDFNPIPPKEEQSLAQSISARKSESDKPDIDVAQGDASIKKESSEQAKSSLNAKDNSNVNVNLPGVDGDGLKDEQNAEKKTDAAIPSDSQDDKSSSSSFEEVPIDLMEDLK